MGTHLGVFIEIYPMNTNMTGFKHFPKIFALLYLGRKVASALEGLIINCPRYLIWWSVSDAYPGNMQSDMQDQI